MIKSGFNAAPFSTPSRPSLASPQISNPGRDSMNARTKPLIGALSSTIRMRLFIGLRGASWEGRENDLSPRPYIRSGNERNTPIPVGRFGYIGQRRNARQTRRTFPTVCCAYGLRGLLRLRRLRPGSKVLRHGTNGFQGFGSSNSSASFAAPTIGPALDGTYCGLTFSLFTLKSAFWILIL